MVIAVAAVGILVNGATALLFSAAGSATSTFAALLAHGGHAGVSLGVVIAGIVMMLTGWAWLDPAVSLAIGVVILIGTWDLLRESVDLALDAVPRGIEPQAVQEHLAKLPGVVEVHDFHVWPLSTTEVALTAHLVVPEKVDDDQFLARISRELHDLFEIEHVTVQIERGTDGVCPCGAPAGAGAGKKDRESAVPSDPHGPAR